MKIHSLLSIVPLLLAVCEAGIFSSSKEQDSSVDDAPPTFRYDYKLTFKKPYYYNDSVPFWETGGDVIKADNFIRLSLSVPNSKGYIWSKIPNMHEDWESEIRFRVSGSHLHGGRGMAFWYAKEPMVDGPVFGSKDKWDGLSVWLDSANPVTHKPSIMAIVNQGNLAFAAGDDPTKHNLGSCSSTYRNAPGDSLLKVKYVDKTLTVSIGTGEGGDEYRICLQKSGVSLPKGYYFGMSAASHNPADDHDIISFETRQLNPPQKKEHHKRPLEDQKIKAGQEYSGIADEQKERIEEAEFQMRRLREAADENQGSGSGETALTMTYIYDAQRRAIESIRLLQLQVEAMGAPSSEDIITGDYEKTDINAKHGANQRAIIDELNQIAENLRIEAKKQTARFERIASEQEQKMKEIQDAANRLEQALTTMDQRMSSQSVTMQQKMSEVYAHSAETKGFMSTLLTYVFYAIAGQFVLGAAGYIYWKLRVERKDKKLL